MAKRRVVSSSSLLASALARLRKGPRFSNPIEARVVIICLTVGPCWLACLALWCVCACDCAYKGGVSPGTRLNRNNNQNHTL